MTFVPPRDPARDPAQVSIRPAGAADRRAVVRLVRTSGINPLGLRWPAFVVAEAGGAIVGCCQLRRYRDGAVEFASFAVARNFRGAGLGTRLIDALLADPAVSRLEPGRPVHALVGRGHLAYFERWGFEPVDGVGALPGSVRRLYRAGLVVTQVRSWLSGRDARIAAVIRRG